MQLNAGHGDVGRKQTARLHSGSDWFCPNAHRKHCRARALEWPGSKPLGWRWAVTMHRGLAPSSPRVAFGISSKAQKARSRSAKQRVSCCPFHRFGRSLNWWVSRWVACGFFVHKFKGTRHLIWRGAKSLPRQIGILHRPRKASRYRGKPRGWPFDLSSPSAFWPTKDSQR